MKLRAILVALAMFAPIAPASFAAPAAPAAAKHYSVEDTEIGVLIDDKAARAIIDKHIPKFSENPSISMARGMTLKTIQQFKPDTITNSVLAAIQADFNRLPGSK